MRADLEFGTIARMVRSTRDRFGDRDAVVDEGVRWTFGELVDRIEEAAKGLMAIGLEQGDRVAIWAPNSSEWIVAALGTVVAGGVLVPINTRYKGAEAAFILERSRARVLFTTNGFLGTDYVAELERGGVDLPCLQHTVVIRGAADAGTIAWADLIGGVAGLSDEQLEARATSISNHDVCDIIFTSGTSGRPKGVMTTHDQNLRVFRVWADTVGLVPGDRYLMINPYFHIFGYKAGILASMLQGATMYPEPVFDVQRALAKIETERITMLPGAPTVHQSILDHPDRDRFDLTSLRLAVTGAAVVPVEMIARMRSELCYEAIVTAYGLTESTGTISICRPDDDPDVIARTSGRPIPDIEVRIVDDAGDEVAPGEAGEIVCRGYNVMLGYLDDDDATAAVVDPDGWLHTGDVGTMSSDGYLAVTDRKKDMFIVGGFNVYPAEVENSLLGHPGVAQVAVIGVPDDRMGEVGHAYVVPRPGHVVESSGLHAWSRERMANYKVPRRFHVVDSLPTNASGKIVKHELGGIGP